MAIKVLLISLMGGILALDRVYLQAMISRPIVAAPLVGFVLGDAYSGLLAGALLELFWTDHLPIGTYLPPNDFLAAFLAASSSIMAGQHLGHVSREIVAFAILLFIPFGYLGRRLDGYIIQTNDSLYEAALQDAKQGATDAIARRHLTGLGKVFVFNLIFILFSLAFGLLFIVSVYPLLPYACLQALNLACLTLPILGVAAGLNTINLKGAIPIFCVLFLLVSLVLELIRFF